MTNKFIDITKVVKCNILFNSMSTYNFLYLYFYYFEHKHIVLFCVLGR